MKFSFYGKNLYKVMLRTYTDGIVKSAGWEIGIMYVAHTVRE